MHYKRNTRQIKDYEITGWFLMIVVSAHIHFEQFLIRVALMVMKKFQLFIDFVELAEMLALHEAIFKALDASIYPLRAKTDSLILWSLLTKSSQYSIVQVRFNCLQIPRVIYDVKISLRVSILLSVIVGSLACFSLLKTSFVIDLA